MSTSGDDRGSMWRSNHRAPMAAVIARFQADLRRLTETASRHELTRVLITLDPTRGQSAAGFRNSASGAARNDRKRQNSRTPVNMQLRAPPAPVRRSRKSAAAMSGIAALEIQASPATATTIERMAAPPMMATSAVANTTPTAFEASTQLHAVPRTVEVPAAIPPAETHEQRDWEARRRQREFRREERRLEREERRQWRLENAQRRRAAGDLHAAAASSVPAQVNQDLHATNEPGTEQGSTSSSHQEWTRDAIVTELASWMLDGATVRASFVSRYGPPGLVVAACRIFGDFDAALEVAAGHVAKLYPDTPAPR